MLEIVRVETGESWYGKNMPSKWILGGSQDFLSLLLSLRKDLEMKYSMEIQKRIKPYKGLPFSILLILWKRKFSAKVFLLTNFALSVSGRVESRQKDEQQSFTSNSFFNTLKVYSLQQKFKQGFPRNNEYFGLWILRIWWTIKDQKGL